jgi:peroxiredoxin
MKQFATRWKMTALIVLMLGAGSTVSADQPTVRANIQEIRNRKQASAFRLEDASGKQVKLSDYRGKVVLLNFWATECGGCVKEMPYFMDFAQAYQSKGLAVVGLSMEVIYAGLKNSEEGWNKVKPFVQTHKVNYPVLMVDERTSKQYSIDAMPDTLIIDRKGRVAAAYVGIVDRDDLEANMKAVIAERN